YGVVNRSGSGRIAPQLLNLAVLLDQINLLLRTACHVHVVQGSVVNGEEHGGGAVLRCHIGDHAAVAQRQLVHAGAEELYKLADHAQFAQILRDDQYQVRRQYAVIHLAGQLDTHHGRQGDGYGQTHHHGFGFNTTHTPAQNAQAVNHRRVSVGAHTAVGVDQSHVLAFFGPDNMTNVLDVQLVHDAFAGRHDSHAIKVAGTPAQEGKALAVTLVFACQVDVGRLGVGPAVHLQGVVNNDVNRDLGAHAAGVTPGCLYAFAQGRHVQ